MAERSEGGSSRGCFKSGCIGCLILVGAPIVLGVILLIANLAIGPQAVAVENLDVSRDLASTELPPALPPESGGFGPKGEIVLHLQEGSFTIVPGEPGEPVRVEGTYDAGAFELTENYTTVGELDWRYEITFAPKRGWYLRLFNTEADHNRVRIVLPRNMPLKLRGYAGMGEFDFEFGGLHLLETDLELGAGDHTIRFSEPLPQPATPIALEGSFGALQVHELGNASPETFRAVLTAGEMHLGLGGLWRNDSKVTAETTFGAILIDRPDSARLLVDRASVTLGERSGSFDERDDRLPEEAPAVHLDTGVTTGEIRIR
jgi:hypothetical protein